MGYYCKPLESIGILLFTSVLAFYSDQKGNKNTVCTASWRRQSGFYEIKKNFFNLGHQKEENSYVGTSDSDVASNAFST